MGEAGEAEAQAAERGAEERGAAERGAERRVAELGLRRAADERAACICVIAAICSSPAATLRLASSIAASSSIKLGGPPADQ